MVPTALSQILEQTVNAVVSVLAAWQLMRIYAPDPHADAWGAAGGTLGTLAGAAAGLVLVVLLFLRSRPTPAPSPAERPEAHRVILRRLLLTILPVILSQTIYQIGYTLDDFLFGNLMALRGMADAEVSALQGVFNTQYNLMVNLPVSVATAMAASAVPSIVSAKVAGSRRELHRKITAVLKLNMAIAIPSAVGLALLAHPVLLPFTSLGRMEPVAARLLETGSSAAIFYALSTITTAILQGCDYMRTPVEHCAVSLAVHVALTAALLRFTSLGVYAMVIGNVTFPLLVSAAQLPGPEAEAGLPLAPGPHLWGTGGVRRRHGGGHLGQLSPDHAAGAPVRGAAGVPAALRGGVRLPAAAPALLCRHPAGGAASGRTPGAPGKAIGTALRPHGPKGRAPSAAFAAKGALPVSFPSAARRLRHCPAGRCPASPGPCPPAAAAAPRPWAADFASSAGGRSG
jgi:hypothetical protein